MEPMGRVIQFSRKNADVAKRLSAARAKITSLVSKDAMFNGVLRLQTGVKIDGIINGGVIIESAEPCMLVIDKSGEVEGNILASRAIIAGSIRGSIHATEILVRSTAKINGDIFYQRIHIEEGAEVNGQLRKMIAQSALIESCEEQQEQSVQLHAQA